MVVKEKTVTARTFLNNKTAIFPDIYTIKVDQTIRTGTHTLWKLDPNVLIMKFDIVSTTAIFANNAASDVGASVKASVIRPAQPFLLVLMHNLSVHLLWQIQRFKVC